MKQFCILLTTALLSLSASTGFAQNSAFDSGWTIEKETTTVNFVSVKKGSVMEQSSFAAVSGEITPEGAATIRIPLDSVDTSVDLRNVRMRFLFFETFIYPEAVVTTQLTPAMLKDLDTTKSLRIDLPVTLSLHGIEGTLSSQVLVSLQGQDTVTVSSIDPVIIDISAFNLAEGLGKLETAAELTITPKTAVSFNFSFKRNVASQPLLASVLPQSTALEPKGDLSRAACEGRFEILSRTGNINFENGSAVLTPNSTPVLNSIVDVVSRCPGMIIEVSGHTDSSGPAALNERLSQQRSAAVITYMTANQIDASRFVSLGLGETKPIASNATQVGRNLNRRIELAIARYENAQN